MADLARTPPHGAAPGQGPGDAAALRETRAEAAAWHARLHSPSRTPETDAGLQRWLAASTAHRAAFEEMVGVWEQAGGISAVALMQARQTAQQRAATVVGTPNAASRPTPASRRPSFARLALAGLAAVAVASGVLWTQWPATPGYTTGVSEQRSVTLADGTRLTLNTDSQVTLPAWKATREVRLVRGEVYFEVAKDAARPFVVVAGEREVVALGTTFVVRRLQGPGGEDKLSVALLEGKVAVAAKGTPAQGILAAHTGSNAGSGGAGAGTMAVANTRILTPGERLTVRSQVDADATVDKPKLDNLTAWRRGEVVLEKTALKDAVAEMNRYNPRAIMLASGELGALPVSGVFRLGDTESFARAIAALYGLQVARQPDQLVLSGSAPVVR